MLSMPPLTGVARGIDMDIEFDFCEGGPFDGTHPTIIVFMDLTLWKSFMLKKDLIPESLR